MLLSKEPAKGRLQPPLAAPLFLQTDSNRENYVAEALVPCHAGTQTGGAGSRDALVGIAPALQQPLHGKAVICSRRPKITRPPANGLNKNHFGAKRAP